MLSSTPPTSSYTLSELLTAYAAEYLPEKSPRTRYQQERLFLWLQRELGAYRLTDLTPLLLRTWKGNLLTRYKPGTVRRYMACLHTVLNVAVREYEWLQENPLDKVRQPPTSPGRTRFLSEEERRILLVACRRSRQPALTPVVLMAMSTGMRKSEIMHLRWPDIDFERRQVRLQHTKNGTARAVPLSTMMLGVLRQWREGRRHDCEWVFPRPDGRRPIYLDGAWEMAVKRAGLDDFRFHDLRHTAASYLAMSGADLREIAEILGHRSLQMTYRYSHLTPTHMGAVAERMIEKFFDM